MDTVLKMDTRPAVWRDQEDRILKMDTHLAVREPALAALVASPQDMAPAQCSPSLAERDCVLSL